MIGERVLVEIPELHLPKQVLQPGAYLYRGGEEINQLFVVLDGRVVISQGPNDDSKVIDLVTGPTFVGSEVITRSPRYETSARAYDSTCTIQRIAKTKLEELLQHSSQLGRSLLLSETLRAQRFSRRSVAQHYGSVASVAQVLMDLTEVNPTPNRISHINQEFIGSMAGVTRETTNHYLSRFANTGIVKKTGPPKAILILDSARLTEIAKGKSYSPY